MLPGIPRVERAEYARIGPWPGLFARGFGMSEYTIERGLGVRERMQLLANAHDPGTFSLLDIVGVPEGARCLDLGCGGGDVTFELARRAGPAGSAVGIDLDEELLALARREAAERHMNVTFRSQEIDEFSDAGFDVAFARMLLSHVRDPAAIVGGMVEAVRPGALVILHDVHFAGCFTEPACDAYDLWVAWFKEAVRLAHGDLDIGPRLPGMLRAAGLREIGLRVVQPAFIEGPVKQLQQLSMEKVRAAVLSAGLTSAAEYDRAHAELKAFTDDPTTIVASPRMIQTWGRR
jgi:SAM-dependent methyltransferase